MEATMEELVEWHKKYKRPHWKCSKSVAHYWIYYAETTLWRCKYCNLEARTLTS